MRWSRGTKAEAPEARALSLSCDNNYFTLKKSVALRLTISLDLVALR
jgi:hypothetical protein